jgi:hypothetical protein
MEIFYLPFAVMAGIPGVALLPGAALLTGYWRHRRRNVPRRSLGWLLAAAIVWLLYAAYETRMYFWSRHVVAPIRVDLLVLAPVLYVALGVGMAQWWRARRALRREAEPLRR